MLNQLPTVSVTHLPAGFMGATFGGDDLLPLVAPAPVIAQLLELNAAIHNGSMWQPYAQHRPATLGEVKLENCAQEFAASFQQ